MSKIFFVVSLTLFIAVNGFSQIVVKSERVFTGTALFGYINGGADLYYEYGFKELVSRQIIYKDEEFTIDVYTMETMLDAFGIYSVHAYKCMRADSLGRFDCLSQYQLQAVDGNNYISIVFHSGSKAARTAADELYRMFVIDGKADVRVPNQLTYMINDYSGSVKYMKGTLAVNNVIPHLTGLLDGIESYEIWYVENVDQDNNVALFLLQSGRDSNNLQRKIARENIIRRGERFVMMKDKN